MLNRAVFGLEEGAGVGENLAVGGMIGAFNTKNGFGHFGVMILEVLDQFGFG